jgi:hypothetical protein
MKALLLNSNVEFIALELANLFNPGACPATYTDGIGCAVRLAGCNDGLDECCPHVDVTNWPTIVLDVRGCKLCPGYHDLFLNFNCEEVAILRLHVGQKLLIRKLKAFVSDCAPSITLCCHDPCNDCGTQSKRTYTLVSQNEDGSVRMMIQDTCGPPEEPCKL